MNKKGKQEDILRLCKELEGREPEDLRCLYTEYSMRRRNRGAHIWIIAAVFIPLSISGAAALDSEQPGRTIAMAIASILLILAWVLFSKVLRDRCNSALAVCAALETTMLKRETPFNGRGLEELPRGDCLTLRCLRHAFAALITTGWILLAYLHCVGVIH